LINGRSVNDTQRNVIEVLYENGFTFPMLDPKELDEFIAKKEVNLHWGAKRIHLKILK